MTVTVKNLNSFVSAFNKAVKPLTYFNGETVSISEYMGEAEFCINPSDKLAGFGLETHGISLPSKFDVMTESGPVKNIEEIINIFTASENEDENSFIQLSWIENGMSTFIEIGRKYVEFGQLRIADNKNMFFVQPLFAL